VVRSSPPSRLRVNPTPLSRTNAVLPDPQPSSVQFKRVVWSYSVKWERKQSIFWASRWDAYLNSSFADSNARVHWLSIINSLLIVLCLSQACTRRVLKQNMPDLVCRSLPASLYRRWVCG